MRRECEESRGEEKKCPNWIRFPVYRASAFVARARKRALSVTHTVYPDSAITVLQSVRPPAPGGGARARARPASRCLGLARNARRPAAHIEISSTGCLEVLYFGPGAWV